MAVDASTKTPLDTVAMERKGVFTAFYSDNDFAGFLFYGLLLQHEWMNGLFFLLELATETES